MEVIAVTNQKGGVSKTTTSHALAIEFSETLKKKVLLIDFDPQASLTTIFNLKGKDFIGTHVSNVARIFDREMPEPIKISETLFFLPANKDLTAKGESAIKAKEMMLSRFIKEIEGQYDVILIDTNPKFDSLVVNAILACNKLLTPIATGSLDEAGTDELFADISDLLEIYNKKIDAVFLLPTKFNKSRNDDKEVLAVIQTSAPRYLKTLEPFKNTHIEVLDTIPERAVFKDAVGARFGVRKYIEEYQTSKKDILLILENVAKRILKGGK